MLDVRKDFEGKFKKIALYVLAILGGLAVLFWMVNTRFSEMTQLAGFGVLLKLLLCVAAIGLMKWVNVAFQHMRGRDRRSFIEKIEEDSIATAIYITGNSLAAALVFGLILSG